MIVWGPVLMTKVKSKMVKDKAQCQSETNKIINHTQATIPMGLAGGTRMNENQDGTPRQVAQTPSLADVMVEHRGTWSELANKIDLKATDELERRAEACHWKEPEERRVEEPEERGIEESHKRKVEEPEEKGIAEPHERKLEETRIEKPEERRDLAEEQSSPDLNNETPPVINGRHDRTRHVPGGAWLSQVRSYLRTQNQRADRISPVGLSICHGELSQGGFGPDFAIRTPPGYGVVRLDSNPKPLQRKKKRDSNGEQRRHWKEPEERRVEEPEERGIEESHERRAEEPEERGIEEPHKRRLEEPEETRIEKPEERRDLAEEQLSPDLNTETPPVINGRHDRTRHVPGGAWLSQVCGKGGYSTDEIHLKEQEETICLVVFRGAQGTPKAVQEAGAEIKIAPGADRDN
ncbi:hypothetical protein NDU88_005491 [Pleurodeles waltl]|uniref:Uncharacterized protein n=1 Tax=Pleurodeles waltl TaxID=8319 RepID=A0AAV7PNS3_PLEWA|nr:hypothetical protein NDU88_005491 [Pleurodeles waltl]